MQQLSSKTATRRGGNDMACDLIPGRDGGEDPCQAIAQLNARIIGCQSQGLDVPPSLLRQTRQLAAACVAQSRWRG